MAMDVELIRAEDASIAFAEGYRIHPETALLYRGADHAQVREARLKDLEQRIDARPTFGHGVLMGAMMVPSNHPDGPMWGAVAGYRVYEKFGAQRENRLGISAGGFLAVPRLAGAIVGVSLQRRLTDENVYTPSFFLGGQAGAFLTGSGGNAPMIAITAEYLMVHRFALTASLGYMPPFQLGNSFFEVGGVLPQVGVAIVW
jgi:hypothetical protein